MGKDGKNSVRLTTTLSKKQLEQLEGLARKNDVAVAWLARKAILRFMEDADGGPLLPLGNE
jgi:hypothetical protein